VFTGATERVPGKFVRFSFALVGVVTNKPPCIRLDILVTVLKVVGDNTNNGG
jgi:hypothetical protein